MNSIQNLFHVGNYYNINGDTLKCVNVYNTYASFKSPDGIKNVWYDSIPTLDITLVCPIETESSIPKYQTVSSAGVDLFSSEDLTLCHLVPTLVHTGLKLQIPYGYEGQVRPRSGLALKESITVLNSPGTIDADYRGEVGVILINFGPDYQIEKGDRIAQLVFSKVEQMQFCKFWSLEETERGEGGFGHTGK